MDKTISASIVTAAVIIGGAVLVKDTSKMVSASVKEDDVAVTDIVRETGIKTVSCCKDWMDLGNGAVLVPVWSDTGYDPRPNRGPWCAKILGSEYQCLTVDPKELTDGNVAAVVTRTPGTPRAKPGPVVVPEEKPVEK